MDPSLISDGNFRATIETKSANGSPLGDSGLSWPGVDELVLVVQSAVITLYRVDG